MAAPKTPQEMFQKMKGNIREKTGKDFDTWLSLASRSGIIKFKMLTEYMKKEYGLTHGYAQLIAWGVIDPGRLVTGNEEMKFVDELYSGKKADLRPIYNMLIDRGLKMGEDVKLVICKTYSSLRSRSQFAVIAPRTNGAVDLELALYRDFKPLGPMERFKSSNPKFTHRIRISRPEDLDEEVFAALKTALNYNRR